MSKMIYEKEEKMSDVRLVYLRDGNKTPVGCVAYMDLEPNVFTYGVAFLNSEADVSLKEAARHVARERLKLALIPVERKHCQGRFGSLQVSGDSLNQKVSDLLEQIARQPLHGKNEVRVRMVADLLQTAVRLRKQKTEAA
jgi:hypothetical protein